MYRYDFNKTEQNKKNTYSLLNQYHIPKKFKYIHGKLYFEGFTKKRVNQAAQIKPFGVSFVLKVDREHK